MGNRKRAREAEVKVQRLALADQLWRSGCRDKAITLLETAMNDVERGRNADGKMVWMPSAKALRTAEYVLARTDPQQKTPTDDLRANGGELQITVRYEQAPKPG